MKPKLNYVVYYLRHDMTDVVFMGVFASEEEAKARVESLHETVVMQDPTALRYKEVQCLRHKG